MTTALTESVTPKRSPSWRLAPEGTMMSRLRRATDDPPEVLPSMTPEEVVQACREFTDWHVGAELGPASAVLRDHNLEAYAVAGAIRGCLKTLHAGDGSDVRETIDFLSCLLELDDTERLGEDSGL